MMWEYFCADMYLMAASLVFVLCLFLDPSTGGGQKSHGLHVLPAWPQLLGWCHSRKGQEEEGRREEEKEQHRQWRGRRKAFCFHSPLPGCVGFNSHPPSPHSPALHLQFCLQQHDPNFSPGLTSLISLELFWTSFLALWTSESLTLVPVVSTNVNRERFLHCCS